MTKDKNRTGFERKPMTPGAKIGLAVFLTAVVIFTIVMIIVSNQQDQIDQAKQQAAQQAAVAAYNKKVDCTNAETEGKYKCQRDCQNRGGEQMQWLGTCDDQECQCQICGFWTGCHWERIW